MLSGLTAAPLPGPERPTLAAEIQAKCLNSCGKGKFGEPIGDCATDRLLLP